MTALRDPGHRAFRRFSRREEWCLGALVLALWMNGCIAGQTSDAPIQVVTLGTGGGPKVQVERSQPASALVVDQHVYLIDAGDGVQRQLAAAHMSLPAIRAIFITHHHLDHDAGLGPLLMTRWLLNDAPPLPILGPPGTASMLRSMEQAFGPTVLAPITIGAPPKPPVASSIAVTDLPYDLDTPREIFRDQLVRVLAITNDHYHFQQGSAEQRASRSYALRFETREGTVVFTGDTGPSSRVEKLAAGADILVSEVIDLASMEGKLRLLPGIPVQQAIEHMRQDHMTPQQVGRLAAVSGVRSVVLTHLVPGVDGETDLSGYLKGIDDAYHGPVVVARDLDRFPVHAVR